jgi:cysteine sulfinate desulfinase/cysteine desulfurase-like protein
VDHVPFDAKGFVDPDAISAAFNARSVVAINHASNVIGTVQPIARRPPVPERGSGSS